MKINGCLMGNGVMDDGMALDKRILPMVIPMKDPTDLINDMGMANIRGPMVVFMVRQARHMPCEGVLEKEK